MTEAFMVFDDLDESTKANLNILKKSALSENFPADFTAWDIDSYPFPLTFNDAGLFVFNAVASGDNYIAFENLTDEHYIDFIAEVGAKMSDTVALNFLPYISANLNLLVYNFKG